MKKIVWAAAIWAGLSSAVLYAQPSDTVLELMDVMKMEEQMSSGFNAMLPMVDSLSQQWQLTPEKSQELRAIYRDWFDNAIDRNAIIDQIAEAYDRSFSEAEMRDMITFYQTPTGQKVLEKMPELTQTGAQFGMQEGQKKQHLLEEKIRVFFEENVQSAQ